MMVSKLKQPMYYFRGAIVAFWIIVITLIIVLYYYLPDLIHHDTTDAFNEIISNTANTIIQQKTKAKMQSLIPPSIAKSTKSTKSTKQTKLKPSISSRANFQSEPYHDPKSKCNLPIDLNHDSPEVVYTNKFPSDVTIEQIIAKRSEPIENIPMCPNSDRTNYDQFKEIISKMPNNLLAYTNRCQINAIGRGKRQFGGLLSGDPLFPYLSTQIGFLHVYKSGTIYHKNVTICNHHYPF